jgi:DNA-binding transcriptional LysR family regulator
MRFTLRQIEYFVAAGETGSITLASERINISQPSISTAITHLEQELGAQLFVRHHAQGLSLTPVGRLLLIDAKQLLAQAEHLYVTASDASDKVRGQLALGFFVPLAPMVMPELTHSFTRAFPEARIATSVSNHEELIDGLRHARIDAAITYDLMTPAGVNFLPLASLPPHIVVGEAHPLARKSAVTLAELASESLILLDLPISSEYFLALFMKEGLEPTIAVRSPYHDLIRTMVANSHGYTIANVRPRSDVAMDGRRVVRVRLAGDHRPMLLGLASLGLPQRSRLLAAFEKHCRSFISDSYIPGMVAPMLEKRRRSGPSPS